MRRAVRRIASMATASTLLALGPQRALAQVGTVTVVAGASQVSVVSADDATRLREDGVVGATALRVHLGRFAVGAGYAEGAVGVVDQRRVFAEVSADAAVSLTPWLALRAGPVSRLIRRAEAQERWVQWRGALVTRAPIRGTPFMAHSALWGASGAVLGTRANGRGASAGVAWHSGGTAVLLEYAMDELSAAAGARRTVEQLRLHVEIGASRR